MQPLRLKPNALRLIFQINSPHYNAYDDISIKTLDRPARINAIGAHAGVREANIPISPPTENPFNAIYNRWGFYKNTNLNGAIYYAEQDPVLWGKTKIGIAIYPNITESVAPRTHHMVSFWGEQTTKDFIIKAAEVCIEKPQEEYDKNPDTGKIETIKIPMQTPHIQRALLLAARCYKQLFDEVTGIQGDTNLDWIQNLSDQEALAEFDNKYGHLAL